MRKINYDNLIYKFKNENILKDFSNSLNPKELFDNLICGDIKPQKSPEK